MSILAFTGLGTSLYVSPGTAEAPCFDIQTVFSGVPVSHARGGGSRI